MPTTTLTRNDREIDSRNLVKAIVGLLPEAAVTVKDDRPNRSIMRVNVTAPVPSDMTTAELFGRLWAIILPVGVDVDQTILNVVDPA